MGFGIGLGAFMDGVRGGAQTANFIKGAIQDRKVRKMEKQAFSDTAAARDADIAKGISTTTDEAGVTTYGVGDTKFSTEAEAHKAAEAKVGSFMDYYRTNTAPKLIDGYMRAGQPERAAQLQTYLDSEDGKARFKDWAGAAQRFAMGDNAGGFDRLAALNKRLNNGVDIESYSPITEEEFEEQKLPKTGEVVRVPTGKMRETGGWRVNWKDSSSGRVFAQDFDTADDFARTALWGTSPEYQAQFAISDMKAAQAARAAAAKDDRAYAREIGKEKVKAVLGDQRDDRNFRRDMARDEAKDSRSASIDATRDATRHGYDLERDNNEALLRQQYPAPAKGETEADVRKSIETITRRMSDADISASNFAKLPPAEQTKRAIEVYNSQRSAARGVMGKSSPAPAGRGIVPDLY